MDVDEVKKNIKKKMYIAKFLFSNGILSCKESLYYYFSNQSFTNSIPFHISIVSLSQFFFYNRKYENNRRTRIFSLRAIVQKKKKIEKIQVKGAMKHSRGTNNKSARAKWLGSDNAGNKYLA